MWEYIICLVVFAGGKKMNARTNGMRGNVKTMGREKLLLALQSSH